MMPLQGRGAGSALAGPAEFFKDKSRASSLMNGLVIFWVAPKLERERLHNNVRDDQQRSPFVGWTCSGGPPCCSAGASYPEVELGGF
jgi:hypothetical protein